MLQLEMWLTFSIQVNCCNNVLAVLNHLLQQIMYIFDSESCLCVYCFFHPSMILTVTSMNVFAVQTNNCPIQHYSLDPAFNMIHFNAVLYIAGSDRSRVCGTVYCDHVTMLLHCCHHTPNCNIMIRIWTADVYSLQSVPL